MVYKTEKHGVRTGNTFKRWNTKYFRNYKRSSYLVRSHINRQPGPDEDNHAEVAQFGKTSALGEGDSMTDGIEYSLNKQARWELPGILENKILLENHEEDYGIELVERHRIGRLANCINVCSTSGVYKGGKINKEQKFRCKNRGGYCQSNSVLKNTNTKKRNRRRRRAPQTEQPGSDNEPEIKDENKLRYEVLRPVPKESYLCNNNKAIGMNMYNSMSWISYKDKQHRCRKMAKLKNHIEESLAYMDESLDDSDEESIQYEANDLFGDDDQPDYKVTLDEILLHANTANKLFGHKRRLDSHGNALTAEKLSAKDHIVYIERTNVDIDKGMDSIGEKRPGTLGNKKIDTHLEPVRAILLDELVTPQKLAETYGKHYIECECFPRKFILNISDRVNELHCFKSHSETSTPHAEVCLVFVHDVDNEINNLKENVYKIFLNANFSDNLSSIRIETIFDYMETNVDELIERSLFFIETLPEESLVREMDSKSYKRKVRPTHLEQYAKWSTNAYNPGVDFLFNYFIARSPDVQEAVDMGFQLVSHFASTLDDKTDDTTSPKDRFCCICYSSFDDSTPGTSLIACSHWFCDLCWKEYLKTKIFDGALSLKCPEFDCDKSVDAGTIMSLINVCDIIKYAKRCHDTEVEQQATTKWCPNEKCGRVLKINNIHTKTCQCLCGLTMCFDCLGPPHWPASCEAVKKYYKKLRESGDINIEPPELRTHVTVQGKPCPACHQFVEKNGGCPYMTCVCNAAFCWGCGQLWNGRTHGDDCYKHGYKNTHGTTKRTFAQKEIQNIKSSQRWYKMALIHRIKQHPARVRALRRTIKPLSKIIQGYVFKSEKSGIPVALNCDPSGKTFDHEYEKVPYFVRNTLDLYTEINHVVENTAVLISDHVLQGNLLVIRRIIQRLSTFSDSLYDVFENHEAYQAKALVYKITELRFHSEKSLQSLIKCIKSMDL